MVLSPVLAHVESASQLTALLSRQPTPTAIAAGIVIAYGFGAVHALAPGHGKTLVGAYLVGSRGTPQAAFWLGITTTVTHTLAVFILGMTALLASHYIDLDRIYPILGAASGVTICLVGLRLLALRLKDGHHHHPHPHTHHHHPHTHHHHPHTHHHHPHTHHHHPHTHHHYHPAHHHDNPSRKDWRSLLAIGISGGLVPCPSALVLLLSAISLHQITYGLVLLGGFSLGLASVLTTLGLAVVYGHRWLESFPIGNGFMQRLSVVSALGTVCIGIGLTTVAMMDGGMR